MTPLISLSVEPFSRHQLRFWKKLAIQQESVKGIVKGIYVLCKQILQNWTTRYNVMFSLVEKPNTQQNKECTNNRTMHVCICTLQDHAAMLSADLLVWMPVAICGWENLHYLSESMPHYDFSQRTATPMHILSLLPPPLLAHFTAHTIQADDGRRDKTLEYTGCGLVGLSRTRLQ